MKCEFGAIGVVHPNESFSNANKRVLEQAFRSWLKNGIITPIQSLELQVLTNFNSQSGLNEVRIVINVDNG